MVFRRRQMLSCSPDGVTMRFAFVLLLVLTGALRAIADEMILVYPGKTSASKQAQERVLGPFAEYVEGKAGWGKNAFHATYFNDEALALQALQGDNPPAWGILSLSIYAKWKKAGKQITLVAQSELDK